jgi:putative ABC transport system permease protein
MTLVAGRDFSEEHTSDQGAGLLLNESAARFLGWDDPVGRQLYLPFQEAGQPRPAGTVVGVLEDFNFASLHEPVQPLVLMPNAFYRYLTVRFRSDEVREALGAIEATWDRFVPDRPIQYSFVDDQYARLYEAEARLGDVITAFSLLAVLVACLGLFGLSAYTIMQRTKEVGIRKVLGASVSGIVVLLSKDFTRLVGIAFVVAAPVAYVVMNRWLEGFAYHIEVGAGVFIGVGVLAFAIAWLTVGYQSVRAALADPVDSLRYE